MEIFFFQAEDGIRDHCVTGVQTCALPIFMTNCLYRCQTPLFIDCVSVGILKKLKNYGKPQRREVEVDFPEDNSWDCFFDELEIAPPEPLLVMCHSNFIGDSTTSHISTV